MANNPPRRPRRDLARRRRCPITESLSACGRTDRDARPASEATAGHARPSKGLLVAGGPGGSELIITAAPSRLLVRLPLLEDEEHGPTRALGRSTAACMATLCTSSASPARARARASESVCAGVHHGGLRAAVAKSRSEPPPSELLWRRRRGGGDSEANPLRAFPSARAHASFAGARPRFTDWEGGHAKRLCGWREPRPVGARHAARRIRTAASPSQPSASRWRRCLLRLWRRPAIVCTAASSSSDVGGAQVDAAGGAIGGGRASKISMFLSSSEKLGDEERDGLIEMQER